MNHKVVHVVDQEQERDTTYTTSIQHATESSSQSQEMSQEKEIKTIQTGK
jgi:hypothetical protein